MKCLFDLSLHFFNCLFNFSHQDSTLITTTEENQHFQAKHNVNIRKRPIASLPTTTASPHDSKRPNNLMMIQRQELANIGEKANCSSSSQYNKYESNTHAISTTTNGLTASNFSSSSTLQSTVLVKNVISSMIELIKGSAEAEKKILCLECHTKIKWIDYFTHICESDK